MSELDAIWKQIPTLDCPGTCADRCTSKVALGRAEAERLGLDFGKLKSVPGFVGRLGYLPDRGDGMCRFLTKENRCSVYKDRPTICRVACVAEDFQCWYGCVAKRYLPSNRAKRLLRRAVGAKS